MKKITLTIILVFFVCIFLANIPKEKRNKTKEITETRAIYFSYIEFNNYIRNKKETESKENIKKVLDNIKEFGFNTIIVHVRPFADSIYKSEFYPISNIVLNNENTIPSYDVLEYFIKESHKRNIKIEAWINPFRISNQTDLSSISIESPYYKFAKDNNAKIIEGKGIYLNPASDEVQKLIINGIKEIIEKYDIDGIHFDDYFYPDKTIDLKNYEEYQKNNGTLSIEEYRLNNITTLIKNVSKLIKETKKKIRFGIAPEGNIENNYNNNYIDIKKILEKDYIDYIMPQIYYGFENQVKPFTETIKEWNNLIKNKNIKLIPALAIYKSGTIDNYAGTGKNEWIENNDVIKKEIVIARSLNNYQGFSLFRYEYIFNKEKMNINLLEEIKQIKSIL